MEEGIVSLQDHLTEVFYLEGCGLLNYKASNSRAEGYRLFRANFGGSPECCAQAWTCLRQRNYLPHKAQHAHMLYALLFLKTNATEDALYPIHKRSKKTFRKYCWEFIKLLSLDLGVINWQNRFDQAPPGVRFFVSLDGTDCPICEPQPFDPAFFSHKLNGPGLKYEIGLNIRTGDIVWINGGVPCGAYPDIQLARSAFVQHLVEGELAIADDGYQDATVFVYPRNNPHLSEWIHSITTERHEHVNSRLKSWGVLKNPYRADLQKHRLCFKAIANLVQISFNLGERLGQLLVDADNIDI